MKKHLLKGSFIATFISMALASQSQTVYYSEDFSSGDLSSFTLTDDDGDGENWYNVDAGGAQAEVATSASWAQGSGALNPDNWMVTPAIDLTGASGSVFLSWKVYAQDQDWADENYSVYVATAQDIVTLEASTTNFTDIVGTSNDYIVETLDVSAFAGQTVYVGFRHHNVSNEFRINIDDINVQGPANGLDLSATGSTISSLIDGDRDFTMDVENVGNVTVTSFDLEYSFDGGSVQTVNVTGVNLDAFDTYSETVTINGITAGNAKTFTYEITNINGGTADITPANNTNDENYDIVVPVPNFTLTDTYGVEHDLHTVLSRGQAVVLDFFASWCGPCESSTPALNTLYENNNSGVENLMVYGITIEQSDNTDAAINGLGWGATYPKFKFSPAGYQQYYHYCINHGFNSGSIPFFVMICPNVNDPGHSDIVKYDVGFGNGMFAAYQTELDNCASADYSSVSIQEEAKNENNISIYPNPFTNIANVNFTVEGNKDATIDVYNTVGQKVISNDLGTVTGVQNVQIDGSDLEAGVYLVNITIDGEMTTKRITLSK